MSCRLPMPGPPETTDPRLPGYNTSALTSRTRCPCSHTDHSLVSRPPCTDDTGAVVPGAHPAAPRHSGTHTRSPQVMRRPSPPSTLTTRTTAPRHWRPAGPSSAHLPPPKVGLTQRLSLPQDSSSSPSPPPPQPSPRPSAASRASAWTSSPSTCPSATRFLTSGPHPDPAPPGLVSFPSPPAAASPPTPRI